MQLFFLHFSRIKYISNTQKNVLEKKPRPNLFVACAHFVFLVVFGGRLLGSINICKNKNLRNQKCIKFKSLIKLRTFQKKNRDFKKKIAISKKNLKCCLKT